MAKISIDTKITSNIKARKVLNPIINGTCHALERLDSAANEIEVIKISLINVIENVPFISVKLIMVITTGEDKQDITKTEKEFEMFCHEKSTEQFLAQGIVRNFQEAITKLANHFDKQAEKLRNALAILGGREHMSENDRRCRTCGYMPQKGEKIPPCPECAKCSGH